MRFVTCLLVLSSIITGQDTLIINSGVTYLGTFVEQDDTHVLFQREGSPIAQRLPNSKVLRIGLWDGVSMPQPEASIESTSNPTTSDETSRSNPEQRIIGKGVKGGLCMSKFIGEDASLEDEFSFDPMYIQSFSVGGFIRYRINDQFSIRPEILYTSKGNLYEISEDYSEDGVINKLDVEMKMQMNWVELPVLGEYQIRDKFKVFCGPYLERFLSGESKIKSDMTMTFLGETFSESDSETEKVEKEDINNTGYGLIIGGEYAINPKIGIEARYSYGLSSLAVEPEDWNSSDGEWEQPDIRNSGILLMISYNL